MFVDRFVSCVSDTRVVTNVFASVHAVFILCYGLSAKLDVCCVLCLVSWLVVDV